MRWLGPLVRPSHRLGAWLSAGLALSCGRMIDEPQMRPGAAPADAGAGAGGTAAEPASGGAGAGAGGPATAGSAFEMAGNQSAGGAPAKPLERREFANYALTGSWPQRPVALTRQVGKLSYTKVTVHDRFLSESCAIGDYDGDGNPDISAGRRWYPGPDFATEHVFRGGHDDLPRAGLGPEIVTGVADDQADYAFDVDGDGDVDIINVASPDVDETMTPSQAPAPQPHATAYWYENPGPELAATTEWQGHLVHDDVRHEQHGIGDVDGDGLPELYGACRGCMPTQTLGYYRLDAQNPTKRWTYHAVSEEQEFPFSGTGWMHGLGLGDVNLDGRLDLLERDGVWLDVLAPKPNTLRCPSPGCGFVETQLFGGSTAQHVGGSHMFAFDVDGDGDGDVVSADNAHSYGISWYEQTAPLVFSRHRFLGDPERPGTPGVMFSQPHALEVADMDGDGVSDVITGKTRFANPDGCGDPDLQGAPVVYVFKTLRDMPNETYGGSVTMEPHLVDDQVGIGRQLAVGHLNRDGIMDLCVASKLGLYVFLGQ